MNAPLKFSHFKTPIFLNQKLTSLQCGSILKSLTNSKFLKQGQQLHAHLLTSAILTQNTYLFTKISAFYAVCGKMAEAHVIFDQILVKNSFLCNSMIRGYSCNNGSFKALSLYRDMLFFGQKFDNFTYPFVLKACGDLGLVEIGRKVHCELVVNGFEEDVYVGNSLLAMYGKFGDIDRVRVVFDRMPKRDLTSWNSLISNLVKNGASREALVVFRRMGTSGVIADCTTILGVLSACVNLAALELGRAVHGYVICNNLVCYNVFVVNSLIEMYCSCNLMGTAIKLFDEFTQKDIVSWNSMISGYVKNEDSFGSLSLFCRMFVEYGLPDQVTLVSVLGACAEITALQFGISLHAVISKLGFGTNVMVGTALIDMYSKCGNMLCSEFVFNEMPNKNMVSWSAMITAYGLCGKGKEALSTFHEMKGSIIPDEGVFASVLSACSHSGLVSEGKEIFYSMGKEYNCEPLQSHYSCMIDLLGRAGYLNEAYQLIQKIEVQPTSDMWVALLSACRIYKNIELAEISAHKIIEMNPNDVSSYIALSNIYAIKKKWDDVERVRSTVREKKLQKEPGCSFVEVNKVFYRFMVGDKSNRQTVEIYAKLKELSMQLRLAGYKPDLSSVFYNVEEEIKEKMLWEHSERLAIAFAMINTVPGTPIRIKKNLRTCDDCHTVAKLISKLTGREIIMRDIRRYHHFKYGSCTCGDYW
ncbi:putative pentatricopeptide repeat-containing protein At3g11460, mitochondrial [Apium graveolens]|uniref:putative pentatricopeptide repeat-containing protein At3g11460, mitochondrial n=1 Tax=Apium graveolens TaxID=4045 RepID=UPI003D7B2731